MIEELKALDKELFLLVNNGLAAAWLDWLCPVLRDKMTWVPFYIAAVAVLLWKKRAEGLLILVFAGITILLCDQIASSLIKPWVQRIRPCSEPLLAGQVRMLVHCGKGFSFLSSHAANHFGLALFLSCLLKQVWARVLLFVWAFSIGFSQVYVGVHYPGDVFCGALLGILTGYAVFIFYGRAKSYFFKL
jgi:membrane-associated phospholipid phosphatase